MNWYKEQLKISQRKIEFSEEQLRKLKQLSEQGVILKELSKIFGVSIVTLRRIIKEHGQNWNIPSQIEKTRNANLKKWTQDELQVIKELLQEGENYNQIAKLFNVSFPTIKSLNKKYNLVSDEEMRAIAEEKLREKYEYITNLYLPSPKGEGLSLTQIERGYGVAGKTVINALKALGLYEEFFRRPSDANRHRYETDPELRENQSRTMKELHRNNPELAEQHSKFMKQLFIDEPERANEFGNRVRSWWKQFEDEGGGNKLRNRLKSFPTREQAINSLKGFVMSKRSKNPNEDLESMAIYNKYMQVINDHTFPDEVQQQPQQPQQEVVASMNWYKKAQIRYNKVKRIDYFRYHKDVQMEFYNEELLDKMVDDLRDAIQYILTNSNMYENPESIYSCSLCGAEGMSWYQGLDDDNGRGDPRNVSDLEMGHWECDSCGEKIGFEEYFEQGKDSRGNWIYTEQGRSLLNALHQIDQAKSIEQKHMYFEQAIQFVHGSGRMSEWLIEGGTETINNIRQRT